MTITFIDLLLFLSLIYLIINSISLLSIKKNTKPIKIDNNIVFDEDINLYNINLNRCKNKTDIEASSENKLVTEENSNSNFENKKKQRYDRINDRYNRKLNNIPDEKDLINIMDTNILDLNDDLENEKKIIMANNLENIYDNKVDIDSKVFNKSNKSQKLFKDSKTIANRFTKNSIIDDYKSELDYYENLRTPWWSEN